MENVSILKRESCTGCGQTVTWGKGKFAKAVIYALCDRKTLKEKVKQKFTNHPAFLAVLRKTYKTMKFVFRKG